MLLVLAGPSIRDGTPPDLPFIREMLYESAFAMEPSKPPRDAIEAPQIIRYLPEWGRIGDRVLVAELMGEPAGAAWYRLFPATEPGYGFVDAATPELSIAVAAGRRGQGVGTALLASLLTYAARDGFGSLSLSVARSNATAIRLYERHRFKIVAADEAEDGLTMRAPVRP